MPPKDKKYDYFCTRLLDIVSINENNPSTIDFIAKELGTSVQEAYAIVERAEEFGVILCRCEEGIYQPASNEDLLEALYLCGIEESRIHERRRLIRENLVGWLNE